MLVLASGSPRRRDFLAQLGIPFVVKPSQVDETQRPGEPARAYAERLAREKAAAVGALALAADTVVVLEGEVLGKPRDRADAARMLRALSGREHTVITAVCVGERVVSVESRVRFAPLGEAQIGWLVASGECDDKAGAYGVQGLAGAFIERIEGSYSNVVGLPLHETLALLREAGVRLPWD